MSLRPEESRESFCRLCGERKVSVAYDGPMREAGAGSAHTDDFKIVSCSACGIEYLDPFPGELELETYYRSEEYWKSHHGDVDVEALRKKLGWEQDLWLEKVGADNIRGGSVLDYGCGAGLFLDRIKGIARETVGVDAALHFKAVVEANGHSFVPAGEFASVRGVDCVVSFDTLEHVEDPRELLSRIYASLSDDGKLYLGVPNRDDYLKSLVPAYLPHFYHKSHLYYFSADTLTRLLTEAGFRKVETGFLHKYDLMNMIVWARDGRGQGRKGSRLFDSGCESAFRANVEKRGVASHLFVRAEK